MFGDTPTVNQRFALPVAALDQDAGHGVGAAREDTHLVVHQLEIGDVALIAAEILAQRLCRAR